MNRAGRQDEGIAIGPAAGTKCVRLAGLQNAIPHKIGGMRGSERTKARQRRGRTSEAPAALAKGALVSTAARTTMAKIIMRMFIFTTLLYGLFNRWFLSGCGSIHRGSEILATRSSHRRHPLRIHHSANECSVCSSGVACAEQKISHVLPARDSESGLNCL